MDGDLSLLDGKLPAQNATRENHGSKLQVHPREPLLVNGHALLDADNRPIASLRFRGDLIVPSGEVANLVEPVGRGDRFASEASIELSSRNLRAGNGLALYPDGPLDPSALAQLDQDLGGLTRSNGD